MTLLQPALDVGSRRGGDAHPTGRRARATRTLYEDGGRSQRVLVRPFLFAARGDGRRGGAGPGGAPAAAQRRGRTTWARDETAAAWPSRRRGAGWFSAPGGARSGRWGAGLISLSPPRREDLVGWEGLRSGGASQSWAVYAARALCGAPAGAKGLSVVSIHQIASASLRAMSMRATFAPRCLPRRVLVRW